MKYRSIYPRLRLAYKGVFIKFANGFYETAEEEEMKSIESSLPFQRRQILKLEEGEKIPPIVISAKLGGTGSANVEGHQPSTGIEPEKKPSFLDEQLNKKPGRPKGSTKKGDNK